MALSLLEEVQRFTEEQAGESPFVTQVKGLTILRSDHEKPPCHLLFAPALFVVLQGAKWAIFGDTRLEYRAGQALVVSIEMPACGTIVEASPTEPYLGLIIEFDLGIMREAFESLPEPPRASGEVTCGFYVADFDGPMADCALRMVRLLRTPHAAPTLYPLIMREICFWLLTGPRGGEIARMTLANGRESGVIRAIHALRERFRETVRIEDLARIAQMSPSVFHRQFKALTSATPLQYQKQLRLIEARRLIATDQANVETAAFRVGYESPSQFSREYHRMFGAPPRRDIAGLRALASAG